MNGINRAVFICTVFAIAALLFTACKNGDTDELPVIEDKDKMKAIFIDIDGVLNSDTYYEQNGNDAPFIDESRIALIKQIVDATGAKIVLSSSRKIAWEKDYDSCTAQGKYISDCFAKYGLTIYDKTTDIGGDANSRNLEIINWVTENGITSFVVIDDMSLSFTKDRFIRTKPHSLGLDEDDVITAIKLLS